MIGNLKRAALVPRAWETFAAEASGRFGDAASSSDPIDEADAFRRQCRYVITGSVQSTSAQTKAHLLGAILSSPELLAFITVIIAAISTAILFLLVSILEIARTVSQTVAGNYLIGKVYEVLSNTEVGVTVLQVSVISILLLWLALSPFAMLEEKRILTIKGLFSDEENADEISPFHDRWFEVTKRVTWPGRKTISNAMTHPITFIIITVVTITSFTNIINGVSHSVRDVILAYLMLFGGLFAGWIHCWSRFGYTHNMHSLNRRERIVNLFAGLNGVLIAPILVSFGLALSLVICSVLPGIAKQIDGKLSAFATVAVFFYGLYHLIWLLRYNNVLFRVFDRMKSTSNKDQMDAEKETVILPSLTFIGWCKRGLWMMATRILLTIVFSCGVCFLITIQIAIFMLG